MKKSKEVFQNRGNGSAVPNGSRDAFKSEREAEAKVLDAIKSLREGLAGLTRDPQKWKEGLRAFVESAADNAARAGRAREVVLWRDETGKGHDTIEDRSKLAPLMNNVMPQIDFLRMGDVANIIEKWFGNNYRARFRQGSDGKDELVVEPTGV